MTAIQMSLVSNSTAVSALWTVDHRIKLQIPALLCVCVDPTAIHQADIPIQTCDLQHLSVRYSDVPQERAHQPSISHPLN